MEQKLNPSPTGSPGKGVYRRCRRGWGHIFSGVVDCFSRFGDLIWRMLWPQHRFEEFQVELDHTDTSSTISGATTMSGFTITALEDSHISFSMGGERFDQNLGAGDGKVMFGDKISIFEKYATIADDRPIGRERNVTPTSSPKDPSTKMSASKDLLTSPDLGNITQDMSPIKEARSMPATTKSISVNQDKEQDNNSTTKSLVNLKKSCSSMLSNVETLSASKDLNILSANQESTVAHNPLIMTNGAHHVGVQERISTFGNMNSRIPRNTGVTPFNVPITVDMKTGVPRTYVMNDSPPTQCITKYSVPTLSEIEKNYEDTLKERKSNHKVKDSSATARDTKCDVAKETKNDTNSSEKASATICRQCNAAENQSKAGLTMASVSSPISNALSPPTPSVSDKDDGSNSKLKLKPCVSKYCSVRNNFSESSAKTKVCVTKLLATSNWHELNRIDAITTPRNIYDGEDTAATETHLLDSSNICVADPLMAANPNMSVKASIDIEKLVPGTNFARGHLGSDYDRRLMADYKAEISRSKESLKSRMMKYLPRRKSTKDKKNVISNEFSKQSTDREKLDDEISTIEKQIDVLLSARKIIEKSTQENQEPLEIIEEKYKLEHFEITDTSKREQVSNEDCELFFDQRRTIFENAKQPKPERSLKSLDACSFTESSDTLERNQHSNKTHTQDQDETLDDMIEIQFDGFPNDKIIKLIGLQLARATVTNNTHILSMEQVQVDAEKVTFKAVIEERETKLCSELPVKKRKADISTPKSLRVCLCGDQEILAKRANDKDKELKITVRQREKFHDIPVNLATSSRLIQHFIDQSDNGDLQNELVEYVLQTAMRILSNLPDSTKDRNSIVDEALSVPLNQNYHHNSPPTPPPPPSPIPMNKGSSHPITPPPSSTPQEPPPLIPGFVPTTALSPPMPVPTNKDSSNLKQKPKFQRKVIPKLIPEPFEDFRFAEHTRKLLADREKQDKPQNPRDGSKDELGVKSYADKSTYTQDNEFMLFPNSQHGQNLKQLTQDSVGFIPRNEKCIQVDLPSESNNPSKREGDGFAFCVGLHNENFDIGTYRIDGHVSAEKARKGHIPEEKQKVKTRGIPNKHLERSFERSFEEDSIPEDEEETVFGNPDFEESFNEDHQKLSFLEDEMVIIDSRHMESLPYKVLHEKKRVNETPQMKGKNKKRKHARTSTGPESKTKITAETFFKFSDGKQKLRK